MVATELSVVEADAADAFCGGDEEGHGVAQEEDQTQEEEEQQQQQEVECAVSGAAGFAPLSPVSADGAVMASLVGVVMVGGAVLGWVAGGYGGRYRC